MVLAIMGLLDLGRAVYTYNTLAQSARAASRKAMVNQTSTAVRTEAIGAAPNLGLVDANVDVCFKTSSSTQSDCSASTDDCPQSSREIGCLAIVRTHVSYAPMTPVISSILSAINISSTSIEPIEYVCPVDPATTC